MPDPLRIIVDSELNVPEKDWRAAMKLLGNQRPLEEARLKTIATYIDTVESTFPNSIILAASSEASPTGGFDDEIDRQAGRNPWGVAPTDEGYRLTIPQNPRLASVVDGQHRLYSFLKSRIEGRSDFYLLCSIFFELPQAMQAMVFATINTNQKPVPRSLALNLYGYNVEDEPNGAWSPEKLAVFLTRRLNFDADSPLNGFIRIDAAGAPEARKLPGASRLLPLAAVVDGILRLITTNYKRDRDLLRSERFLGRPRRKDLPEDSSALRDWYRHGFDHELYEVLKMFSASLFRTVWRGATQGSMLTRAVGVRALYFFLGDLISASSLGGRLPRSREELESMLARLLNESERVFSLAAQVDFSNPFFEATGRGQTRIRNVLNVLAELKEVRALPGADQPEYRAVLRSAGTAAITAG